MRLVSYTSDLISGFGVLTPDESGVIDLGRRMPGVNDLGQLIESGRIDDALQFLDEPADVPVANITYERLLPWPSKIFCIGVN